MKFGKTYEALMTAEWRQMYMNYTELKAIIRHAVEGAPNRRTATYQRLTLYYRECEMEFFTVCDQELERVNLFFAEKLAEARRKYATLMIQMIVHNQAREGGDRESAFSMTLASIRETRPSRGQLRKLRLASSEFYLSLVLLKNYQALNLTAFRKICKKYDKNLRSEAGSNWYKNKASDALFTMESELNQMITGTEDLYTRHLANGDRAKAMHELRVPQLGQKTPFEQIFCAGLFLGLFIVASIICVISYMASYDDPELLASFVRIYRGPFLWILNCFCVAINVYMWQNWGVNHVLIFEVNPRNHIHPATYLSMASILGYICTLTMLAFLHHHTFGIDDPYPFPLTFMVISVALLFNPIHIMNYPARIWLITVVGRVILAPFYYVNFADFWLGDQLNSLVLCIVDHYYFCRFYVRYYGKLENTFDFEPDYVVAVLRCLPAWFRFAQSLRRYRDSSSKSPIYLLNAVKYFSTLIVVLFSTIQMETNANYQYMFDNPWVWGYLLSATASSMLGSYWDLVLDFGLFQVWHGDHLFLRENLIYPKWFYYFIIWANTLLRFLWIMEFYLTYQNILLPYNSQTILGTCEILRRLLWNFFRMEHEHLYNCGNFRATREIYITALNARQEQALERLMEESDHSVGGKKRDSKRPKLNKIYF